MNEDYWEVGIVYELCPCCGNRMNPKIIIPEKFDEKTAKQIKEADGKVIGISEKFCKNCQDNIDNEYVLLVGIDPEKSKPEKEFINPQEAYRTGNAIWVAKDELDKIFDVEITTHMVFVEDNVFENMRISETKSLMDIIQENK